MTLRINVGCGAYPLGGHVNIDLSSSRADVTGDFMDMYGHWSDAEHVEMSHVLEHVSWRRVPVALAVVRSWLGEDGTVRIEVPDMTALAARGAGHPGWEREWFGTQTHPGEYHLGGFTVDTLGGFLERSGFRVTSMRTFDSDHPERIGYPCIEAWAVRSRHRELTVANPER